MKWVASICILDTLYLQKKPKESVTETQTSEVWITNLVQMITYPHQNKSNLSLSKNTKVNNTTKS